MEKYATRPEVGKISYENGFDAFDCIVFISPPRFLTLEATIWEWKSGKPARQYPSCPAFIETDFSDFNKELCSRTLARMGHWSSPDRPDQDYQ